MVRIQDDGGYKAYLGTEREHVREVWNRGGITYVFLHDRESKQQNAPRQRPSKRPPSMPMSEGISDGEATASRANEGPQRNNKGGGEGWATWEGNEKMQ